jgi:hypothetical protein
MKKIAVLAKEVQSLKVEKARFSCMTLMDYLAQRFRAKLKGVDNAS